MEPILKTGRTAWRIEHADRVSFLVDGEAYYGAVALALAKARHSVFILGWDIHSRVRLLRGSEQDAAIAGPQLELRRGLNVLLGKEDDGLPSTLGARLSAILARNPELQVYVLDWDFPVILSKDRETRTRRLTDWPRSKRFHFVYDSYHPGGASHHQKLVVVDDSVVLGGGMDIGVGRWDTSEHLAKDPRRSDPEFPDYVPAHDVMMMADGAVARAVAELVRERWKRATGEDAEPLRHDTGDCWPEGFLPDATDISVGISRTQPEYEQQMQVVEIERLYLTAIAAAQRQIYIENQYLTSDVIVRALVECLQRENGPQIVIVLPQNNFGWFEARTIQVLHFRRIKLLQESDVHGRLRICYPIVPELGETQINLHSKVLVVDDRFLRIGSSNLTNRSMRLDTECDFSIEATDDDPRVRRVISALRNRLLGEHLCLPPYEVAAALETTSLVALVDEHTEKDRCLRPVVPDETQVDIDIGDGTLIDPKAPITTETVIETFAPPPYRRRAKTHLARIAVMLVVLAALAACWRWTPLKELIDPARLASLGAELQGSAIAPFAVIGAYVLSGLVALPVTVLILATAAVFGPWLGMLYSLAGSLASATLMFAVGRVAGRNTVESLTGRHFQKIARGLRGRGLLTMIAIRVLPVAPFTIVNMVVGTSPMRFGDFALGTVIGMLPGIVGLSLFQTQLELSMREPGMKSLALLALVSALFVGVLAWLRQRLRVGRQARQSDRFHAFGGGSPHLDFRK
ncbi:MAG TPA: VTT domain-containing protein [Candidatus Limnocylindrales bacterium]|nr:VTT domain-containing protein [Candidatus Limnocylindrales bacterium]